MHTFDRILVVKEQPVDSANSNDLHRFSFLFFVDGPTKINFDILVSSFGPIQDMDMVCCLRKENLTFSSC